MAARFTASWWLITAGLNPPLQKHEALTGLFLCAKPDEAFFCPAIFKLGSNPVEPARYLPTIVGVLVDVKRFEQKHPLISAEVNGLGGFLAWHEWIACSFLEWSVL